MHQKAKRWEVLRMKVKIPGRDPREGTAEITGVSVDWYDSWTLTFMNPVKRSRARRLFMSGFEESNLWHADRQIAVTQWEVGTSRCHWKSISPHLQWAEDPWLQLAIVFPSEIKSSHNEPEGHDAFLEPMIRTNKKSAMKLREVKINKQEKPQLNDLENKMWRGKWKSWRKRKYYLPATVKKTSNC